MNRSQTSGLSVPEAVQDVVRQPTSVTRAKREAAQEHRGVVVWITGRPGSGKSTLADATERQLYALGLRTVLLDGDNLRLGLCSDLGFSEDDRNENVRRAAETAKLFMDCGIVVLVALVSPIRQTREQIKKLFKTGDFFEIFCCCPPSLCEDRDPKGHYARARRGEIKEFTGVSSQYEEPLYPALRLETGKQTAKESTRLLTNFILSRCVHSPEVIAERLTLLAGKARSADS
ncbi:adenylyl-sulfate kinase [Caballeronia sp. dw_276]|uniref:adenylyl-sulfate kinase n=1 Tax=Caballeronia sp. dw_276 TaxID=2719795 RepID=UPI001BD5007C|nr:adenylyl-sulfate kinase [Caballeronia sp. dw_276]